MRTLNSALLELRYRQQVSLSQQSLEDLSVMDSLYSDIIRLLFRYHLLEPPPTRREPVLALLRDIQRERKVFWQYLNKQMI